MSDEKRWPRRELSDIPSSGEMTVSGPRTESGDGTVSRRCMLCLCLSLPVSSVFL